MHQQQGNGLALRHQCLVAMWVERSNESARAANFLNAVNVLNAVTEPAQHHRTTHRVSFDRPGRATFLGCCSPVVSTVQGTPPPAVSNRTLPPMALPSPGLGSVGMA
jgi:hypothetical protein